MTDDLVKRLRKVEPDAPGERTRWHRNPDGPEAADRIEALEAALRDIASGKYSGVVLTSFPPKDPAVERARAALGEKKDGA